jgi:hypothetical protein
VLLGFVTQATCRKSGPRDAQPRPQVADDINYFSFCCYSFSNRVHVCACMRVCSCMCALHVCSYVCACVRSEDFCAGRNCAVCCL